MVKKLDAEKIIDLAFHPVRRRPNTGNTFDSLISAHGNFQTHSFVRANRIEIVNNLELPLESQREMHTGDIAKIVKGRGGILSQKVADWQNPRAFNADRELTQKLSRLNHGAVEFRPQFLDQRMTRRIDRLGTLLFLFHWSFRRSGGA